VVIGAVGACKERYKSADVTCQWVNAGALFSCNIPPGSRSIIVHLLPKRRAIPEQENEIL
jgi:hypothetical protein